ncbi:MAG TPA: chorismate pyruvate-lyase family protein [Egibacteraceae bacterium]|jgi:chorismate-pyruvate lyase|nr:chorismate pyruvate-lyase family protein [Egibacteraceae bacterium]
MTGTHDTLDAGLRAGASPDALQRILLTTDGTVVQLLESWFDDPIELAGHEQFITPVQLTDEDLQPAGHETILRRRVLLRGRRTGRNYVYADTAVVLDRLSAPVRESLLSSAEPIGRVLRRHRVETFREILRTGRRPVGALAGDFGCDSADQLLFRVYRVVSGGLPIMLIAEHFPAGPLPSAEDTDPQMVVDLRDDVEDTLPKRPCGSRG